MVRLTSAQKSDRPGEPRRGDDLSSHTHRQLIGYIGLAMPVILILMAWLMPPQEMKPWTVLGSISAYFHTGASAAFVGMLVALALFLFTYRGYDNEYHWADRAAAIVAGIAALGVAIFPTDKVDVVPKVEWVTTTMGVVHLVSAVVLFAMFAVFALWLFRLSKGDRQMSPAKVRRNRVYLVCGLVILGSIVWCLIAFRMERSIFLPESIALVAFAVSWLVKGEADRTIARALGGESEEQPQAARDG